MFDWKPVELLDNRCEVTDAWCPEHCSCVIMCSTRVVKWFDCKCCHLTLKGLFSFHIAQLLCVCVCLKCALNSQHEANFSPTWLSTSDNSKVFE